MVYLSESSVHGFGVFADKNYNIGDTLELCYYLVTDDHSELFALYWNPHFDNRYASIAFFSAEVRIQSKYKISHIQK